jgi:hypothetical protein
LRHWKLCEEEEIIHPPLSLSLEPPPPGAATRYGGQVRPEGGMHLGRRAKMGWLMRGCPLLCKGLHLLMLG